MTGFGMNEMSQGIFRPGSDARTSAAEDIASGHRKSKPISEPQVQCRRKIKIFSFLKEANYQLTPQSEQVVE